MATGEYVSVSSQADIEGADLDREKSELKRNPDYEREELAQIYVTRGLDLPLARQVATRLMEHDALGAHARDELGMFDITKPRPIQAAMASAASFIGGAALPLIVAVLSPPDSLTALVVGSALVSLVLLGGLGAQAGGVPILRPIMRILVWGALSLGLTMLIGEAFGFKS
jgi:VIT1/CCC1 family predicted Fe2+/Mn2+ transporter